MSKALSLILLDFLSVQGMAFAQENRGSALSSSGR